MERSMPTSAPGRSSFGGLTGPARRASSKRWCADPARIEGHAGGDAVEVALVRPGSIAAAGGARKRIRVNGVARRATALSERLRVVLFAPEDMLLVVGSPSLRRATVDQLASTLFPTYPAELATYGRALQQRNGLL